MSDKGVTFTEQAARKIADTVRKVAGNAGTWGSTKTPPALRGIPGYTGLLLAKTTEAISPNTFGTFKFTSGGRGAEATYGDEYEGYWFWDEAADDLASDTLVFVYWVPNSDTSESGWVITPVLCPA